MSVIEREVQIACNTMLPKHSATLPCVIAWPSDPERNMVPTISVWLDIFAIRRYWHLAN
jgi:hypothetical protein